MAVNDDPVEIAAAAPVAAARRALVEWATSLGLDVEDLAADLVIDERFGPDGEPVFCSYALRREKASEVFASAGKPVPITRSEFAARLAAVAPPVRHLLEDHLADNGELLLHPFVTRVRDLAIEAFDEGTSKLSGSLVEVFEAGLRDGDAAVENAVAVSFVEDTAGRAGHHSRTDGDPIEVHGSTVRGRDGRHVPDRRSPRSILAECSTGDAVEVGARSASWPAMTAGTAVRRQAWSGQVG
jgi:hypothetical protein